MKEINAEKASISFPIAIIVSRFNTPVTSKLLEGALRRAKECDLTDITVIHVPGAVEIPLIAQKLAQSKKYEAIVCLGAVIRGETTHYDYVCDQASQGCQKVMLDHGLPVIFGVLTTENAEQAFARVGGNHGHKGEDAIDCAIEMVSLMGMIN